MSKSKLQSLVDRLRSLTPQNDLHVETLAGCGWKVSCCQEEGSWVGWIEGKTLREALEKAIAVMESRPHGPGGREEKQHHA